MRRPYTQAVEEFGSFLERLRKFRQGEGNALPDYAEVLLFHLRLQPDGAALLADVQEWLRLSPWQIGRGSQQLARIGLVRVTRSTTDGRSKLLTLTSKGRRLIDRLTA